MKVQDIFKKKVACTSPDSTVLDAARLIFGQDHKGLPVIQGKNKKLVGFITEQDIISRMFPSIKELMEDYVHERDFESMESKVKPILTKKVKELMTKKLIAIKVTDPVLKAEAIMKTNDISRLPVIDKRGNLIGIISKGDIFRALVSPKVRGFK